MRKVRCCITKEYGTTDTFYNEGGRWYKSKEICEAAKLKQKLHNDVIQRVLDYLHYENGQPVPSMVLKCLDELKWYGDDVILRTFSEMDRQIQYYCSRKNFTSVSGQIKYIFAIIGTHIPDVYKRVQQEQWAEKPQRKQQPQEELPVMDARRSAKNITKYLEDE